MSSKDTDIAIIGAGTSGCFIAGQLHDAGFNCVLLEKSRGLGGRCSRRYLDDNYSIDLGAPEFLLQAIESPSLISHVQTWIEMGYLDSWVYQINNFDDNSQSDTIESLCAAPSMNAWHKQLAGQVKVLKECKINSLTKTSDSWHLFDESGQRIVTAQRLIVTCPAEQSLALLKPHKISSDARLISDNSLPQFVCAVGFTEVLSTKTDVYRGGHNVLAAAIRENSKPDRTLPHPMQEVWLLHSTHDWAQQHGSANHQHVAEMLANEFCEQLDLDAEPHFLSSHYWRLARHQINESPESPFIWNKEMQIGCCGDWLSSGDVAGALNSAVSLFEEITSD